MRRAGDVLGTATANREEETKGRIMASKEKIQKAFVAILTSGPGAIFHVDGDDISGDMFTFYCYETNRRHDCIEHARATVLAIRPFLCDWSRHWSVNLFTTGGLYEFRSDGLMFDGDGNTLNGLPIFSEEERDSMRLEDEQRKAE